MMKEEMTMTEFEKTLRSMLTKKENISLDEYFEKHQSRESSSVDGSIAELVAMGLRAFNKIYCDK
jgi:hypothetical protein